MTESGQDTESALAAFRFAVLRRCFNQLPSSELPELAINALLAGLDTPSIRELAGELHPTWADSGPLFDRVLNDLEITIPTQPEAAHALARHYAEQILSGDISPYEGARHIWWEVANYFYESQEIFQQYSVFVGLASMWEDHELGRPEYEQRIRDEAAKLLKRQA